MVDLTRRSTVAVLCGRLWGNAAVEHRARLEIAAFLAAGLEVTMLTQQAVDDAARARWPELVALDPVIDEPSRAMGRHTATKFLAFAWAAARFMKRSAAHDLAAVVSHSAAGVVGAYPAARRHGVRLIYVCHTSPRPRGESLPTRHRIAAQMVTSATEHLALRIADLLVCPAPSSRDFYARHRRRPTIVVRNPVDLRLFAPTPAAAKDVDVLYVGRLAPEKGPAVLLRAVARVRSPLRVAIVGSGTELRSLQELSDACAGPVTFPGVVPNDRLPSWYRRARLVAVPSFTEAAGMVPVEAMACGTPVMVSNVTGLIDTVTDEVDGWLAPAGDDAEWARLLADALGDDARLAAVGEAGVVSARRFDSEDFVRRVVQEYGLDACAPGTSGAA